MQHAIRVLEIGHVHEADAQGSSKLDAVEDVMVAAKAAARRRARFTTADTARESEGARRFVAGLGILDWLCAYLMPSLNTSFALLGLTQPCLTAFQALERA